MELNWSTFLFEVINFFVLVWILKHFLYQPIQKVMAERQAEIAQKLADATAMQTENEALNERYQNRVNEWKQERQQKRQQLNKELDQERAQRLDELQKQIQQERDKAKVSESLRQADTLRHIQQTALNSASQFAHKLLQQGAGQETETRLIELAITDLKQLSEQQKVSLHNQYGEPPSQITIQTAFPISDSLKPALEQALRGLVEHKLTFEYLQNEPLIAGSRIIIGNWVLGLNIQDELTGFVELSHEQ